MNLNDIITDSQRCQRNWDLSKSIPDDHIQILKTAVTDCPSKQNRVFYKCLYITNREVIETIYDSSDCFAWQFNPRKTVTNSQTLANLLVVFLQDRDDSVEPRTVDEHIKGTSDGKKERDEYLSVGIAAGTLNLTAHMLGYKTGFYHGHYNTEKLEHIFSSKVFCMLGIGFPDLTKDRKKHHLLDFEYPTFDKNIKVEEM